MAPVSHDPLFDFLTRDDPPRPADCIFVFAGMPERKRHGIELWRRGLAPMLVLSVGRFEWRRFPDLGLHHDGGLREIVGATPPRKRHFFVTLSGTTASAARVAKRRFGTRSEALALRELAAREGYRTILVVSTSVHLRRAALTLERLFSGRPVRLAFTAVPEGMSAVRRRDWWKESRSRNLVLLELLKLGAYGAGVWR